MEGCGGEIYVVYDGIVVGIVRALKGRGRCDGVWVEVV